MPYSDSIITFSQKWLLRILVTLCKSQLLTMVSNWQALSKKKNQYKLTAIRAAVQNLWFPTAIFWVEKAVENEVTWKASNSLQALSRHSGSFWIPCSTVHPISVKAGALLSSVMPVSLFGHARAVTIWNSLAHDNHNPHKLPLCAWKRTCSIFC